MEVLVLGGSRTLVLALALQACAQAPRSLVQEVLAAEQVTDPRVVQCLLPGLTDDPDDPRVQAALVAARARGGVFNDAHDYLEQLVDAGATLRSRLGEETVPLPARELASLCALTTRPVPSHAAMPPFEDDVARFFAEALRGVMTTQAVRERGQDGRLHSVTRRALPEPPTATRTLHEGRPVAEGLLDLYRPCWSMERKGAPDAPAPERRGSPSAVGSALPELADVDVVVSVLGDLEGFFVTGAPVFSAPQTVWTVEVPNAISGAAPRTLLLVAASGRCADGRLARDPSAQTDVQLAHDRDDRTLAWSGALSAPRGADFPDGDTPRLVTVAAADVPGQVTLTWSTRAGAVRERRIARRPPGSPSCFPDFGQRADGLELVPWPEEVKVRRSGPL